MCTLKAEAIHLHRGFFGFSFAKAIEKEFGFKGSKLLLETLLAVTETGFERAYDKAFRSGIAVRNGVSERLVDMIVHRMVMSGYLDKEQYDRRHVVAIPSGNILSQGRSTDGLELPYYFIRPCSHISSEKTAVSSEEIPISSEETPQGLVYHGRNLNNR